MRSSLVPIHVQPNIAWLQGFNGSSAANDGANKKAMVSEVIFLSVVEALAILEKATSIGNWVVIPVVIYCARYCAIAIVPTVLIVSKLQFGYLEGMLSANRVLPQAALLEWRPSNAIVLLFRSVIQRCLEGSSLKVASSKRMKISFVVLVCPSLSVALRPSSSFSLCEAVSPCEAG